MKTFGFIKIIESRNLLDSFPNTIFHFYAFHLKILKIIQYDFRTGARKKISGKQKRKWSVAMGLIVALWKTDVLKTSIIVLGTSKKIAILGLSSRQNKMAAARALCALLASPLWLLFVFLLDSFLVAEQQTVSMLDKYTSYGKDTTRAIQFPFPPSCPLHGLRFQLHGGRRTFLQGRLPCNVVDCPLMRKVLDRFKRSPCLGIFIQTYNLGHKGWKFHFIRILPLPTPLPC